MIKCNIELNTLVSLKLGFEAYFVLFSLYKKNEELIIAYTRTCKKIETAIFHNLQNDGYILIDEEALKTNIIRFKHLSLTDKGSLLFNDYEASRAEIRAKFDDFRSNYPKKTINGRYLHNNMSKCIDLYTKITQEITHEELCKCARLYVKAQKVANSEKYMQLLETWLNQKNYQQYLEEVEIREEEDTFTDDI